MCRNLSGDTVTQRLLRIPLLTPRAYISCRQSGRFGERAASDPPGFFLSIWSSFPSRCSYLALSQRDLIFLDPSDCLYGLPLFYSYTISSD